MTTPPPPQGVPNAYALLKLADRFSEVEHFARDAYGHDDKSRGWYGSHFCEPDDPGAPVLFFEMQFLDPYDLGYSDHNEPRDEAVPRCADIVATFYTFDHAMNPSVGAEQALYRCSPEAPERDGATDPDDPGTLYGMLRKYAAEAWAMMPAEIVRKAEAAIRAMTRARVDETDGWRFPDDDARPRHLDALADAAMPDVMAALDPAEKWFMLLLAQYRGTPRVTEYPEDWPDLSEFRAKLKVCDGGADCPYCKVAAASKRKRDKQRAADKKSGTRPPVAWGYCDSSHPTRTMSHGDGRPPEAPTCAMFWPAEASAHLLGELAAGLLGAGGAEIITGERPEPKRRAGCRPKHLTKREQHALDLRDAATGRGERMTLADAAARANAECTGPDAGPELTAEALRLVMKSRAERNRRRGRNGS